MLDIAMGRLNHVTAGRKDDKGRELLSDDQEQACLNAAKVHVNDLVAGNCWRGKDTYAATKKVIDAFEDLPPAEREHYGWPDH
jgi:hypothetical protein